MKCTRFTSPVFFLIYIGMLFNMVLGYSNGPPNGRTGAPGESTCVACHSSFGLNSGSGGVTISNAPAEYVPGETYTLAITVMTSGQSRWGFEVCSRTDNLDQGGTLTVTQSNFTTTGSSGGITYLKQRSTGTFNGQPNSANWEFAWTAPEAGTGTITLYAAGNAANGNFSTSGDYIYTTFLAIPELIEEECIADGDMNFDMSTDVLDVVTLVGGILGNIDLTDDQFCAGDINGDMSLDVLDVVSMVGLIIN
ncbi:MAG: hypothetical protein HN729_04200 [Candidatus Marinimicrobia bacterium]|jgi:hypothetical protein|nr:hypothetical protein [Candidatus Neomarinimicrobiota bacterium]MBT3633760.1 hypothetical protein [Candidatus Neomarinimicrobiota bacterium]MBT3682552.1 hypothetical protein [Candidatus Neomarinimicrobiota bacterium]MBT3759316.1 hypothetical protein [Candidatus Neomarinimicrobiota bacterium]MBT3894676.1 hypothetical protein [Candidatus Neomarinimicrobiota bacterium]